MLVYRLPINVGVSGGNSNSVFAQQRLGSLMDKSSRKELRTRLENSFGENAFSSSAANAFMESLPRDLLFCLRCNNLVRGLNRTLGGSSLDRFVAFGASASRGSKLLVEDDSNANSSLKFTDKVFHSLLTKAEADHLTSTVNDTNDALRRAKDLLNRPVSSERERLAKQKTLSYRIKEEENSEIIVIPSFFEFLEAYKVVLRVWSQTLLLDFFLWYRGTRGPNKMTINLG